MLGQHQLQGDRSGSHRRDYVPAAVCAPNCTYI
jgi:hypothetical protein